MNKDDPNLVTIKELYKEMEDLDSEYFSLYKWLGNKVENIIDYLNESDDPNKSNLTLKKLRTLRS